jgi:hypothetical protein
MVCLGKKAIKLSEIILHKSPFKEFVEDCGFEFKDGRILKYI